MQYLNQSSYLPHIPTCMQHLYIHFFAKKSFVSVLSTVTIMAATIGFLLLSKSRVQASPVPIVRYAPYLEIAGGPVWQTVNDVEIPYQKGTRFSLSDINQGPWPGFRIYAGLKIFDGHEFKALYAPFQIKETAILNKNIIYQEKTFTAHQPTTFTYKFNSYRLTYRYTVHRSHTWNIRLGFTGKIRDALIRLEQNNSNEELANLGFVPLLNFYAEWLMHPKFSLIFDMDAMVSPYGRAEDATLKMKYKSSSYLEYSLGYRTVEGGSAGSGDVYTFAWLHFAEFAVRFQIPIWSR